MRIVLADLASADGFVSKDTVVGGYGSRLRPFSRVTRIVCALKRHLLDLPSVQLGYIAALCAAAGHEVVYTTGAPVDGDVALVLTSLVDHRHEAEWADAQRRRGLRVGFVGLTASKLPELFDAHGDFVIMGEPEAAVMALASGTRLEGRVQSPAVTELDTLPFPRWDIVQRRRTALLVSARFEAPVWWRLSAAGQSRLPRVLYLLPAPNPRLSQSAQPSEYRRRARMLDEYAAAAVRRVPRSAVHQRSGALPGAL